MIGVLLVGSGTTLWRNKTPWVLELSIGKEHPTPKPTEPAGIDFLRFNQFAIHTALYSPQGHYILLTKGDHTGRVLNAVDGNEIATLSGGIYELGYFVFSPNEKFICGLDEDSHLGVWDTATGTEHRLIPAKLSSDAVVALSPDGKKLLFTDETGESRIRLWDTATWTETQSFKMDRYIANAVFSPDSRRIAATDHGRTIRIWDLERAGEPVLCADEVEFLLISDLQFSPDGRCLLALEARGGLRVWDIETGKLLYKESDSGQFFGPAVFSPDGRRILLATFNTSTQAKAIRVLDAETGIRLPDWTRSTQVPMFSPDARRLLVRDDSGVQLLDAESGCILLSVPFSRDSRGSSGIGGGGYSMREGRWESRYRYAAPFSPDGTRLIIPDDPARVWQRRRPEYWWGVAWLPEFWLTALFAGALGWSVWRDRKKIV